MSTQAPEEQGLERQGYLAKHGATLIDHGYNIVPIQVGKKAPGFDGWQKARSTKSQLAEWLQNGHKWSGVGVNCKYTPAIDIDVRDEAVAKVMEEWVHENIGYTPTRIGSYPKRLLAFRADEPFRKMRSTKYVDEWGDEHQIEILGDGQQFVAFVASAHSPLDSPSAACIRFSPPGRDDLIQRQG